MNRRMALWIVALAAMVLPFADPARAEPVVLSVSHQGGNIQMTDADLLALPQVVFRTKTQWTDGIITFEGPSLKTVLSNAGITDGVVKLTAVNDYSVTIPWDVIEDDVPVIANRLNGEPFSVREKGPLWLVFPYDADEAYRTEQIFSYSVWQLDRISTE